MDDVCHYIIQNFCDTKLLFVLRSVCTEFNEIIRETNIAYTTCYRKVKWLLEEGLVIVDKIVITKEGKKFSLFHSVLKSINVKYENKDVIIEAEENYDIIKKTMSRFYSIE